MLRPTLDEVKAMAAKAEGNLVPIFREVTADLETPVSAFLKVRTGQYSFLLESVEGGERLARYSFIGTQPYRVLKTGPGQEYDGDPLLPLEQEMARFKAVSVPGVPAFTGGAAGAGTATAPSADTLHTPSRTSPIASVLRAQPYQVPFI